MSASLPASQRFRTVPQGLRDGGFEAGSAEAGEDLCILGELRRWRCGQDGRQSGPERGAHQQQLHRRRERAFGVATAVGYIYWTNLSGSTIGRASLNGGHTPFSHAYLEVAEPSRCCSGSAAPGRMDMLFHSIKVPMLRFMPASDIRLARRRTQGRAAGRFPGS
jgi:hypothetical protein